MKPWIVAAVCWLASSASASTGAAALVALPAPSDSPVAAKRIRNAEDPLAKPKGSLVLPERVLERLPLAAEPVVIGRASTISNTFEIKGAPLRGTLRLGGIEFVDPRLEFQPIMPDANVGSRVLRDFRVSFDTRNKRVRFTRAS